MADFLFNQAVICLFFCARFLQRFHDNGACLFKKAVFFCQAPGAGKSAHHDLWRSFYSSRELVNRDDGQYDAILAQMSAVADHQIFDNVGHGSRINTNAADGYATSFASAELVELQNGAAVSLHDLAYSALHSGGQRSVPPQLAVLTVDRNKISRLHQVDDQLELFLAGVSAHVDRWGR